MGHYAAGRQACKRSRVGAWLGFSKCVGTEDRHAEQVDWMCGLGFRGKIGYKCEPRLKPRTKP